MSEVVYIGIDGTTTALATNQTFEAWDLNFSFVWTIYRQSGASQKIHIPGPDIGGSGTSLCVGQALAFVRDKVLRMVPAPRILLCGYSRGAYAALRVAQGLGLRGIKVDYLGLFDVVKCTDSATEDQIGKNELFFAGRSTTATPESLYRDANPDSGSNWSSYTQGSFQIPDNVVAGFHFRRTGWVNSRTVPMGTYAITDKRKVIKESLFNSTHSGMGGLPFRGDYPSDLTRPGKCTVTRASEWAETGKMAKLVAKYLAEKDLGKFSHPTITNPQPPKWWYTDDHIRSVYRDDYFESWGLDGTGLDPEFEQTLMAERERRNQVIRHNATRR